MQWHGVTLRRGRAGLGFCVATCGILALAMPGRGAEFAFVHPGLLHGREDLARMKEAVAGKNEPIYSGYLRLVRHPDSQLSYRMQGPLAAVGRNGGAGQSGKYDNDATAAYHLALLWAITGDRAYAERSKEIVDAWSRTLKTIDGRDAVLMAGLGPFEMINAAEILRYTDSGWTEAQAKQAEACFKEAVYPVIRDFALYANGNWDTAAMKTMMAMGVFCNDRAMFERAVRYYVDGAGNGSVMHYVINEAGQCQESGRDAGHWQLGLGHLGDCCQIAWNQGLDLYGFADNRLLKAFEYAAAYNLGGTVRFEPMIDRTGKYPWAEIAPRGALRPVYEEIYNHYVVQRGTGSAALERAVQAVRPEGAAASIADHPGFGTLLFARAARAEGKEQGVPAAPAGLVAKGAAGGVKLQWVAVHGAASYTLKRAARSEGPFAVIARDVPGTAFEDRSIRAGELYSYRISARNNAGESLDSMDTAVAAGLPGPWKDADVGAVKIQGWAEFDGRTFTVDGAGRDIGGVADGMHFAYVAMHGDGAIVARFVPQMSAMRSRFGVMMRESLAGDARHVSLLIAAATENVESPGYEAVFVKRAAAGGPTEVIARQRVPEPYVRDGRFLEPFWLRLSRRGERFTAEVSGDGQAWKTLAAEGDGGDARSAMKEELLAGLAACSCVLRNVGGKDVATDTVIRMDHVAVGGWPPADAAPGR